MPDPKKLHTDAALSNFAVLLGTGSFGGAQVCPTFAVRKESDVYYVFGNEHVSDDTLQARAAGGQAGEIDWSVTSTGYVAREYALKHLVPDRNIDNADAAIDPFLAATRALKGKVTLAWEKRIKALVVTTGNHATTVSGGAWSSSGDPEKDIDDAKEGVEKYSGFTANTILIPPAIARVAKRNVKIRALVQYTAQNLLVNGDLPPTMFGLRVVIPGARENTANPGQTASIARVWNNTSVQVCYVDPNPSLESATWGLTFRVSTYGVNGERVKRWRNEDRDGEFVEYGLMQTEAVVSTACSVLITGIS